MSLCASCGLLTYDNSNLCPHHHVSNAIDWHKGNRIMCDFFHRGIVPQRVVTEPDAFTGEIYAEDA